MGKRLSKIYTRTGDQGETGLGDGSRISKTAPRVEAMGSVDELNSIVGVVVEELLESKLPDLVTVAEFLRTLQHRIFDPFFTTKDPGEGTGLGLSIAFTVIQEHQGNIEIVNHENGVEFIVSLPIVNKDL